MGSLQHQTDIVYVYKPTNTGELAWSIASLKNIKHRKVHIIRETKHQWSLFSKYHNQMAKLLDACNNLEVSDNFILMNDDFYILREWQPVNYNRGTLQDHVKWRKKRDGYSRSLVQTDLYLTARNYPSLSFELHTPFVFNKRKLKYLINSLPKVSTTVLQIRSLYGNIYNVDTEYKDDVKNVDNYEDMTLLSTSNKSFKLGIGQYIRSTL